MKYLKQSFLQFFAAVTASALLAEDAHAGANFSTVARNITESVEELPGLLTSVAYLLGLLMGVLGVMKIKDHVENPQQTPLKDGAIRLVAGGALFALPILFEAMLNTIGTTGANVQPASLPRAEFKVR
jgi:hypothetical protein